jgi:hypothetical protein
MRTILGGLLTLATVFFLQQSASAQMLGPEVQPQKYGKCLIYHLRKLDQYASDKNLDSVCNSSKGWSAEAHDFVFRSRAIVAFYNAESAYCRPVGCISTDKDMRLVLVGDPLPNALIVPQKGRAANEPDDVTIIITTTLVDFVLRNAHALMNDLLEDPQLAPQGFYAWLEGLRALGGKSCSLPVKWNTMSVSPKLNEDKLIRVAMTTFQILFAHEIAHLTSNQSCGYKINPALSSGINILGVERACDKMAFAQLSKSGLAMPLFAVATLVGWEHYVTLKRPQLIKEFPGGELKFKETFPVLNMRDRSQALVDDWEATCRSGLKSPMCVYWQEAVAEAKKIINSPAPGECIP